VSGVDIIDMRIRKKQECPSWTPPDIVRAVE
jgi:hypothetical protein